MAQFLKEFCSILVLFCSLECESVKHLVEAQLCMQSCQYMPALLHLFNAHNKLVTWSSYLVVRDVSSEFEVFFKMYIGYSELWSYFFNFLSVQLLLLKYLSFTLSRGIFRIQNR
jgi:KICSTOR complex C12orf66 like